MNQQNNRVHGGASRRRNTGASQQSAKWVSTESTCTIVGRQFVKSRPDEILDPGVVLKTVTKIQMAASANQRRAPKQLAVEVMVDTQHAAEPRMILLHSKNGPLHIENLSSLAMLRQMGSTVFYATKDANVYIQVLQFDSDADAAGVVALLTKLQKAPKGHKAQNDEAARRQHRPPKAWATPKKEKEREKGSKSPRTSRFKLNQNRQPSNISNMELEWDDA